MSTDHDDKWPVEVFRYSHGRGWELFQQALSPDSDGQKITAAPRRGCVEVRELRLRIHVLQSAMPTTSTSTKELLSTPPETTNAAERKHIQTTSMVRRRDTILLSKGDFGAVVLKFVNIAACVAFVDRMVELNQGFAFSHQEKNIQETDSEDHVMVHTGREIKPGDSDNNAGGDRSNAIRSYLAALLHDEDFLGFVDRMEDTLASDDDCLKMLQALAYPRSDRHWPA